LRTKKLKTDKVTIQIVETLRSVEKVYQKMLHTVATVFADDVSRLVEVAEHIKAKLEDAKGSKLLTAQQKL